MSDTTLTQEYSILYEELGFTKEELKTLSFNGIRASFLSLDKKRELYSLFETEWKER